MKELVIHHPMAGSRTVSEMKTFSCTSEVVISLFAQHSLMLNAIDQIVGQGGVELSSAFSRCSRLFISATHRWCAHQPHWPRHFSQYTVQSHDITAINTTNNNNTIIMTILIRKSLLKIMSNHCEAGKTLKKRRDKLKNMNCISTALKHWNSIVKLA